MRISMDLYTIYGDLLVKKNREITPAVIRNIRRVGEMHKQVRIPITNTDIFTDFQKVFDDKRYKIMLSAPVSKKEICATAGKLRIENDLILELFDMKRRLPYTYNHVLRVAAFSIKLALTHRRQDYDMEIVAHCGFTHDIGKTRIPIEILNKKERLTPEERAIIETHSAIGYLLLNYYLKRDRIECSLASLEHHERPDGSGYPNGITTLHKYTKLISPIDVMDALMTKRPYREKAFSLRATLDYLIKGVDMDKFEEAVVVRLIGYARKEKPDMHKIRISKETRERLPEDLFYEKYK